eukprot:gene16893-20087_t
MLLERLKKEAAPVVAAAPVPTPATVTRKPEDDVLSSKIKKLLASSSASSQPDKRFDRLKQTRTEDTVMAALDDTLSAPVPNESVDLSRFLEDSATQDTKRKADAQDTTDTRPVKRPSLEKSDEDIVVPADKIMIAEKPKEVNIVKELAKKNRAAKAEADKPKEVAEKPKTVVVKAKEVTATEKPTSVVAAAPVVKEISAAKALEIKVKKAQELNKKRQEEEEEKYKRKQEEAHKREAEKLAEREIEKMEKRRKDAEKRKKMEEHQQAMREEEEKKKREAEERDQARRVKEENEKKRREEEEDAKRRLQERSRALAKEEEDRRREEARRGAMHQQQQAMAMAPPKTPVKEMASAMEELQQTQQKTPSKYLSSIMNYVWGTSNAKQTPTPQAVVLSPSSDGNNQSASQEDDDESPIMTPLSPANRTPMRYDTSPVYYGPSPASSISSSSPSPISQRALPKGGQNNYGGLSPSILTSPPPLPQSLSQSSLSPMLTLRTPSKTSIHMNTSVNNLSQHLHQLNHSNNSSQNEYSYTSSSYSNVSSNDDDDDDNDDDTKQFPLDGCRDSDSSGEYMDDDSDYDPDLVPKWAEGKMLHNLLKKQTLVNPDKIFPFVEARVKLETEATGTQWPKVHFAFNFGMNVSIDIKILFALWGMG